MNKLVVTILGSGDAFGSGGRLQPCLRVAAPGCGFLVDCGATVMTAMRRYGVDPDTVDLILISHLHGDHFAGIPFFILDAQLVSKRTKPLVIAGPVGIRSQLTALLEAMFPGASTVQRKFAVEVVELAPASPVHLPGLTVTPYRAEHMSAFDALALRIECDGRILAYTGDSEWTPALAQACQGADLVVAEAYYYDRKVKFHLDFLTLMEHWPNLQAARLIVTHMSDDMLRRVGDLAVEAAADGKVLSLD